MRSLPQHWRYILQPPRRYLLLATGFFALAIAGLVIGPAAEAHHIGWLDGLAVVLVGGSLGLVIGLLAAAYNTGVRGPSYARQLTGMVQSMEAGQGVSGRFAAGLRDFVPSSPLTNWKTGRVVLTPRSVTWTRTMTGRSRDLTGAQVTGERRLDGLTEMTLTLPGYDRGENVCVIQLRANGTDLELAAPAQLLEVLRYSLARTTAAATQRGPAQSR